MLKTHIFVLINFSSKIFRLFLNMINKIKLSDYVIQFLEKQGIEYLFMLSGGNCLHLVDSASKAKKLKYICNHHEQACAMAADGYARISGKLGVCLVTNGQGATNV